MPRPKSSSQEAVSVLERTKTTYPPMYAVIMHNDDYTPMDFVVQILQKYFQKESREAFHLMMKVHVEGAAKIGVYTKEIAETRIHLVHEEARRHQYPLTCSMVPEERDDT